MSVPLPLRSVSSHAPKYPPDAQCRCCPTTTGATMPMDVPLQSGDSRRWPVAKRGLASQWAWLQCNPARSHVGSHSRDIDTMSHQAGGRQARWCKSCPCPRPRLWAGNIAHSHHIVIPIQQATLRPALWIPKRAFAAGAGHRRHRRDSSFAILPSHRPQRRFSPLLLCRAV